MTIFEISELSRKNLDEAQLSRSVKMREAAQIWLNRHGFNFIIVQDGVFCFFAPFLVYTGDLRKVTAYDLAQAVPFTEVCDEN